MNSSHNINNINKNTVNNLWKRTNSKNFWQQDVLTVFMCWVFSYIPLLNLPLHHLLRHPSPVPFHFVFFDLFITSTAGSVHYKLLFFVVVLLCSKVLCMIVCQIDCAVCISYLYPFIYDFTPVFLYSIYLYPFINVKNQFLFWLLLFCFSSLSSAASSTHCLLASTKTMLKTENRNLNLHFGASPHGKQIKLDP